MNEIYKDEKTGKWCGIRANARIMGVNPAHLLRVIRGERQSNRLISRLVACGALRGKAVA